MAADVISLHRDKVVALPAAMWPASEGHMEACKAPCTCDATKVTVVVQAT